jgi:hypothetical protein
MKEDEVDRIRSTHADMRNVYKVLIGNPEGMRPLGTLRCRWEVNIGIDLKQVGVVWK